MLHRMWDHISNCYARAADLSRRADQTADSERQADLLRMAESWTRLAQSYELSEQLERALLTRSENMCSTMDWQRAAVAPFDRTLELAVIGAGGIDPIAFPCRRILRGWVAAASGEALDVQPTHWRQWTSDVAPGMVRSRVPRIPALRPPAKVSLLPRLSGE